MTARTLACGCYFPEEGPRSWCPTCAAGLTGAASVSDARKLSKRENSLRNFAVFVLEVMQQQEDWSMDTFAEIADAAHTLGLATTDDAGNFKRTFQA